MVVGHDLRAREAAAINNRGVVKPVGEDHIVFAHQRRDGGEVGGKARLEGKGGLNAFKRRHTSV